jgi:hypothetical protein
MKGYLIYNHSAQNLEKRTEFAIKTTCGNQTDHYRQNQNNFLD